MMGAGRRASDGGVEWRERVRLRAKLTSPCAARNDSSGCAWCMPMRADSRLTLLLASALLLTTTSSLVAQARAAGPLRDSDDAIGKPGALTALETAVLNAMTDRNIVAHLILEDSTEAALAEPISEIVHDTAVSNFAKMMAMDHAHALELDRALVPALRGLPRLSPGDTIDPRTLRMMELRFRGLAPDSSLDRTYVSAEVLHHLHLLNELAALRATAVHAPVQQRIDDEMAIVRAHLVRAQALARNTGVPAP